jgi:O-antigen ligase
LLLLLCGRPARAPWWLIAGVLLGPVAMISTVQNVAEPKFLASLLKAMRLAGVFMPALLICQATLNEARVRSFTRAFTWGGLISVVVGIVGFLQGWEWTRAVQTYDYGEGRLTGRAGGVFQDSGAYGHMVATWIAFYFAMAWPRVKRWRWASAAAVLGVGSVAIYVSMSRAAVFDVLVMAAVQALALLRRGVRFRYVAASLALVLLVAGFFQFSGSMDGTGGWENRSLKIFVDRFATIAQGLTTDTDQINAFTGNRLRSWATCFNLWLEHPLAGVGYKAAVSQYGVFPDNVYMMALLEMGAAGFILAVALFVGFWFWSLRRAAAGSEVALMVAVAWAGQLAHGLTADTLTFPASMSLAIAFACMAWRLSAQSHSSAATSYSTTRGMVNLTVRPCC